MTTHPDVKLDDVLLGRITPLSDEERQRWSLPPQNIPPNMPPPVLINVPLDPKDHLDTTYPGQRIDQPMKPVQEEIIPLPPQTKEDVVITKDGEKPVPRVDLTDEFDLSRDGSNLTLKYGDPKTHGLNVYVDGSGTMRFDIKSDKSTGESGTDMFASAMQRLEREGVRVDVVKCMWLEEEDSTNSDQYLANRAREMTPEQAASNTWSGKILAAYGFTKPYGIISEYGVTTVYFRR